MEAQLDQSGINQLLSGTSADGSSLFDMNQIMTTLQPYLIILTVVSVGVTLLYALHLIQKMRVNRAIMETRDILKEMNARQKAELQPVTPPVEVAPPQTTPKQSNTQDISEPSDTPSETNS